ncbi:unnamed protein product [Caenorhabditis bovis]|uniref:Protein ARV n=1 Tax=Caenorhabditis bovis TaxID=2654633 RepID=A0A8S1ESH0_9PELO|nr:unnamed protein product [Caenorhabditis bovis]
MSIKKGESEYICINCQSPSESLFIEYSSEVIRLTECEKCGKVVDKYIECDMVLLSVDLILQYIEAYRHFLCNLQIQKSYRLFVIFLLSHAYETWVYERSKQNMEKIYDLELIFYKSVLSSVCELSVFVASIIAFDIVKRRGFPSTERIKSLGFATLFGFYGCVAVVLSIIFRLSDQPAYQIVVRLFILISHLQVQRVMFPNVSIVENTIVIIISKLFSVTAGYRVL